MKKIVVEVLFDEEQDEFDDYVYLTPVEVRMNKELTDTSEDDMIGIGESYFQSDFYQIEVSNAIGHVLGGKSSVDLR